MQDWRKVAHLADLDIGAQHVVWLDDLELLLVRTEEGVFALENRCSHAEVALQGGMLQQGTITCPRHGARFALSTGEALSAPAYEPIRVFPLRVDEAGYIWIRDNRWD